MTNPDASTITVKRTEAKHCISVRVSESDYRILNALAQSRYHRLSGWIAMELHKWALRAKARKKAPQ